MKMTKFLISLYCIFGCYTVSAQRKTNNIKSLESYYRQTHTGALNICNNANEEAVKMYKQAIDEAYYPLLTDLNNMIYAQSRLPKPDRTVLKKCLQLIQQKGICVHEFYETRKFISPFIGLVKEHDCKKVQDTVGRRLVQELLAQDQAIRKSIKTFPIPLSDTVSANSLKRADAAVHVQVVSLLRQALKKNIPLENLYGMDEMYSLFTMMQHGLSHGFFKRDLLDSLVLNGLVDVRYYSSEIDCYHSIGYLSNTSSLCREYGKFGNGCIIATLRWFIIRDVPQSCKAKILENRKKFYLQDLQESAKIAAYHFLNNKNGFKYASLITIGLPDGQYDSYKNQIQSRHKTIIYNHGEDFDFTRKF